jgi:hypothetical protein
MQTAFVDRCLCRLIKAGFVGKAHEARLAKVSAWSELVGYSANVALNLLRIRAIRQREQRLEAELRRKQRVGGARAAQGALGGPRGRLRHMDAAMTGGACMAPG